MKNKIFRSLVMLSAILFFSITVLEVTAHARAGSSRSMGSRGSRSYSRPVSPSPSYGPSQPYQSRQVSPAPSPFQQPAGGGFLRSMAGGLVGGMLGGMLFRSLGLASPGMGGGGIGLFEIILLAGIGYLIYRFIKKKREAVAYGGGNLGSMGQTNESAWQNQSHFQACEPAGSGVENGLGHIRQMDPNFDEARFNDLVMDIFFKIQGSWMNRDLTPVAGLLTDEIRQALQADIDKLVRDRQVNRLENIAVRKVDIVEAWQESGQDFITTLIFANLLDYTTEDATGAVVAGSKTEPVKFEEYWTFTRPVGNNSWRLSAIDQK